MSEPIEMPDMGAIAASPQEPRKPRQHAKVLRIAPHRGNRLQLQVVVRIGAVERIAETQWVVPVDLEKMRRYLMTRHRLHRDALEDLRDSAESAS